MSREDLERARDTFRSFALTLDVLNHPILRETAQRAAARLDEALAQEK